MALQITPLQLPGRTDYSAENQAFTNLGQTLGNLIPDLQKQRFQQQKEQILGQIGTGNLDYEKAGKSLIALGDTTAGATLLTLGQKQQQLGAQKGIADMFSGGGGAAPAALGSPNEVENRFLGGVQKAGLTNPNGLAAVAAYGKSESGYNPANVNKTWSDPSESGAAGTSGGIMSWRADRLQRLQQFAANRGEQGNGSPETQAAFLAQEDPTLIPRLNAAKTPQEANQIMANAWRFAGYDRAGGENARREGLTTAYAQRYGNQPAETQRPVQVAENEAEVRRLEQEQAARADTPAPGSVPVTGPATTQAAQAQGFAIPGTSLPPNDPYPRITTQQLYGVLQNPMASDGQRAMAKSIIDNRMKYSDENAPDKREMTRLQTEKLRREVEGEGATPLTEEERKSFGIPEGQAAYKTRSGEIKFGPAGTRVDINQRGESKFEESLGQAQAKRWNGYIEEGDKAQTRLADIQTLRDASRRLGAQGSSANLKSLIGPYAESLGINVDGLSDIQLYESITNRLAPQLRAPGSGSTSDIEFKGFMKGIGPLSNNPAAREMILDTFEAASRNDVARSQIASRLAAKEIDRGQAERELRALPDPMSAFREFRKQNPDAVGQAIKEAGAREAASKRDPVRVGSPDEARKLPSGTRIILPDGRQGQVP